MTVLQAQEKSKSTENDLMYPPAEAAKPFIDFDGAGFTINGQRTYYSSGSIHYPRVPHELWYDRLLRLKRANFAAVQTYTFWNFHELKEGQFDFTGDKDFEGFLDTAQQLGLYATVRVGPYVCAEWDSGGYPVWLKFKPRFLVRTNDAEWLALNDHWYNKILPLVARHQINHGGNVVMVQLENEHPRGWGVIKDDPYFEHLSDEAVNLGIEVPYFMSGQHHGPTPTPDNLDSSKRSNPWITTEFWAGWYDIYGPLTNERNQEIETANWTMLAHGGGGHNFYMLHGGTDFDTWNNDEAGASYDDGAAVGQGGDLRPIYFRMKRANQLAASFPDILADGNDALNDYQNFVTGPGVEILGARKSNHGAGTFVFVRNSTTNETTATFKSGEQLKLAPSGIYPLPYQVAFTDHAKIVDSTLPVLALAHNGQAVTIIVYGQSGETGRLALFAGDGIVTHSVESDNFSAILADANDLNLKITIPAHGVAEFKLSEPQHFIRVLALNLDLSLYTWILGATSRQYIVTGPEFVQGVDETNGNISVTIERPYGQPPCAQVAVFGGADQSWHPDVKADLSLDNKPAPELKNWRMSSLNEASPRFDDSAWRHSEAPLQMGADGDISAFAWYRAKVNVPAATNGTLHLNGNDDLEIFVNGTYVSNDKTNAVVSLAAGTNSIAIFVSHHGRNKAYNYLGSLDDFDRKGLWGKTTLRLEGNEKGITGWAMRGGVEADLASVKDWKRFADTKKTPAFYRATFETTPPKSVGPHPILRINYEGLSRGTMWINGHNLGRYPEKLNIHSLYIPECWLRKGKNVLTVFDETGASPKQIKLLVDVASREVIRTSPVANAETPMAIP